MAAHSCAFALEPAKGKVILTITGKVAEKTAPRAPPFDLAMLEKLPQQTFSTKTPWDKNPIKFKGPLLHERIGRSQGQRTTLKAAALNDYQTSIPFDDATKFDVIAAHQMNDQAISGAHQGAAVHCLPFDTKAELRSNADDERSAWQLKSIAVE